MAIVVYRDISVSSIEQGVYEIGTKLLLNGFESISWSDGTTRTGGGAAPAAASDISATNAWWIIKHTSSGRHFNFVNTDSTTKTWKIGYTPYNKTLSAGDATTPDSHASYTKYLNNEQKYPTSGTTNCKIHLVINNSIGAFVASFRRTPYSSNTFSCSLLIFDVFPTPQYWSSDPEPVFLSWYFSNTDVAENYFFYGLTVYNRIGRWKRYGISGESWVVSDLGYFSMFNSAGSATASPSGNDIIYDAMFGDQNVPTYIGISTIVKILQPARYPTTGIDSGAVLNWAAFGPLAYPNDGIALGS